MGKISSNLEDALAATSTLTGINTSSFTDEQVDTGDCNITAMKTGQAVNNQLMANVLNFMNAISKQAEKFPALATAIEERDAQDAKTFNVGFE